MTDRELMQQALEALEVSTRFVYADFRPQCVDAIVAMRERLAQPEQEPVAWMQEMPTKGDETRSVRLTTIEALAREEWASPIPLYTTPPRRDWVGLTDEERNSLWRDVIGWGDPSHDDEDLMKAIEAKLKEKNV